MKNMNMDRIYSNFKKIIAFILLIFTSQLFAESSVDGDTKISSFQYMKKLNSVFDFVQQNYVDDIDAKILYEGALKGMLDAIGDPYTLYLDSDYMRDLSDTTEGAFGGIGVTIMKNAESTPAKPAYVEVSSAVEGSPGAKAGIQSGDYIIAVEGKPTEPMTMNEVLQNLRGEVGTPVTITILRGSNMKFDIRLIRELIEVPTAKYGMIGTVGYVRLIEFTPDTALRLQDALDEFEKNNYTALIVDLRDNPGGVITGAVNVADKFIDNGPIVTTKSRLLFQNQQYTATESKTTVKKNIPIIVLINHGSASASEIVSGALKDNHLAYLVGERSYGKGSVQQVVPLSETDGIKMTTARYYTPSDVNIDKIGIPPDLEVINFEKLSEADEKLYVDLIDSNLIIDYVEQHPGMSETDIANEAEEIAKKYPLDKRLLRRLIRVQVQRLESPLYDLDYDLQLNEALKIANQGEASFKELIKNTKTLKQLQEEVEVKEEAVQE